jgi:hypothetical protein
LKTAAVRVAETATVWPTVGGAFVEASIWIPDEIITEEQDHGTR